MDEKSDQETIDRIHRIYKTDRNRSRSNSSTNTNSDRVDRQHLYASRCSLQRVVGLDSRSIDRLPPQPACLEDVIRAISSPNPSRQSPTTSPQLLQQPPVVLLSSFGAYHFLPEEDAYPTDTVITSMTPMRATEAKLVRRAEVLELFAMVKAADNVLADRRSERRSGGIRDEGKRQEGTTSASVGTTAVNGTIGTGSGTVVDRKGVFVVRSLWSRLLSNKHNGDDVENTHCQEGEGRGSARTYPDGGNTRVDDGASTSRNSSFIDDDQTSDDSTDQPPIPPSLSHASLNRSHTYAVSMGDTHILLFVTPQDKGRAVRAIR